MRDFENIKSKDKPVWRFKNHWIFISNTSTVFTAPPFYTLCTFNHHLFIFIHTPQNCILHSFQSLLLLVPHTQCVLYLILLPVICPSYLYKYLLTFYSLNLYTIANLPHFSWCLIYLPWLRAIVLSICSVLLMWLISPNSFTLTYMNIVFC